MSQLLHIPKSELILAEKHFITNLLTTRVFDDPSHWEMWKRAGAAKRDLYVDDFYEALNLNHELDTGCSLLFALMRGGGGTVWSNANAHIGIGDSNTAVTDTQTGLIAAVNKFYEPMDATFPKEALLGREHQFEATVADGDAEYAWEEFTLENTSGATDVAFNRIVQSQGTKVAGQVRTITLKLTFPSI